MVEFVLLLAARRLAGFVVVLALVTGLPLAAARAGCVCDHGHQHGAVAAAEHTCTAACTAATCPMHRGARASQPSHSQNRDVIRCSCSGEAQALIGQASVAGVLPAILPVGAPIFAAAPRPSLVETPLSLAASPPAPPPRA
jgi:hypothetical protein